MLDASSSTDGDGRRVSPSVDAVASAAVVRRLRLELAEKQATVDALMQGFLPIAFPQVEGLAFDVLYQPAAAVEKLGGDWYDVFALPDGRTAFSLGDVAGKGVGAAVKMGQAKQAVRVAASLQVNDPMPLAVLTQANKVIFLNDHDVAFTTAVYGVIDAVNRTVTYASAGHHPPILATFGAAPRVMPNHGFALGVEPDMPDLIREHEFAYESGSMLTLYTDGIIEFDRDAEEGERRLLQAARDAVDWKVPHPARFIVEAVLREQPRDPDDIAVLTISFE